VEAGKPDYWDYSTLLELAVLAKDESKAIASLTAALAKLREPWEAETTARNLRLIREVRERRGEGFAWALEIERALTGPST
jgi:MAP3K TRAFs-binding domain